MKETLQKQTKLTTTHPIGCADSLVIDTIALLWQQRGIPVTVVGFVVPHSKWLGRVDASGGELSSEVVLRVEEGGVLEVNGNWVAAQDFCRPPCSAWTFLLHHHLVRTENAGQTKLTYSTGPSGLLWNSTGKHRQLSALPVRFIKCKNHLFMNGHKHVGRKSPNLRVNKVSRKEIYAVLALTLIV